MRKHVTPADPTATIPDPERGCDLPADGLPVTWSAYWAAREARGEITVSDLTDSVPEAADEAPAPEPDPAPAA